MSKLYRHATSEFGLPVYVDFSGEVSLLPAGGLPLMYWPDGRWCFEASLFMGHLARQGLSRRYRGGTLLTYAAHITPLLRYCFANGIDLFTLTDNHFRLFMRGIVGEKRKPVKAKPAPIKQRNAKRKSGKVAKVNPPKKAKVVKVKENEAKRVERETHKETPEEMIAADRYRSGRDRITFNDNWD